MKEKFIRPSDVELEKTKRPEDDLETPSTQEVNRRQRIFVESGKVSDMMKLKIVLEDVYGPNGLFLLTMEHNHVLNVIENPREYAISCLGYETEHQVDIASDEELGQKLQHYLNKFKRQVLGFCLVRLGDFHESRLQ